MGDLGLMESELRISSSAVSDRGLSEKRPQNEDSYLQMPQCGIYAVADGVGGAQAGEVASQMAVEILAEAFSNLPQNDDAEQVMRTAIDRANSAIHQMAQELPQLSNMATTIVALHINGNIATIGHVGDSRLYRVDRTGTLYRETDDHSMVAEEVRAGRMTEEQAENHPGRNIISRALGAESVVDVDLKTIMVEPGNAFLICSDGITRHVSDQEIKGVLTFGGEPSEICEYLRSLCYERGAEDNLTAVVVKLASGEVKAESEGDFDIDGLDIPTVATPRHAAAAPFAPIDGDDEILELETGELHHPYVEQESFSDAFDPAATISFEDRDTIDAAEESPALNDENTVEINATPIGSQAEETSETRDISLSEAATTEIPVMQERQAESFTMFGEGGSSSDEIEKSGSLARIATSAFMLVLGTAIGLGVYHFALVPKAAEPQPPQLEVMRSENIALTSFEKNRRNVDADAAAYLKEVPPADDAEDFYLLGRANILVGDYPKARLALIEAQKRLATVDPTNARILKTDIATALVITNDTSIQNRLKIELESGTGPAPAANTNSNR